MQFSKLYSRNEKKSDTWTRVGPARDELTLCGLRAGPRAENTYFEKNISFNEKWNIASCRFVALAEHEEFAVNSVRHSYRKQKIKSVNIIYSYMHAYVFAVDIFLWNTADIIFSHENMKSGGLRLFQKTSDPRVRGAVCRLRVWDASCGLHRLRVRA